MQRRHFIALAAACAILAGDGGAALARAAPPPTWEGLVRVKSKKLDLVYLAPGADFRAYHKVMLDPTEVAFQKDWKKDYNNTSRALSAKVSDSELQKVVVEAGKAATELFTDAFNKGGYPVVTEAGEDVLRVRTGVVNLSVTAPDRPMMGRSRSFAGEAGYATVVIEVRDSMTGALLGRAVDQRIAGDNNSALRNSVTNRADFRILVKNWAKYSVQGVDTLKAMSPVSAEGLPQK